MKKILIILLLLPILVYGYNLPFDTVCYEDLELRNGLRFKVNSEVPFTGFKIKSNYSDNGSETSEGRFDNGVKDGVWIYWYSNGQKKLVENYANGLKNGAWTYWYLNGQKGREGNYDQGWQTGHYTEWNEQGEKEHVYDLGTWAGLIKREKSSHVDRLTQFDDLNDGVMPALYPKISHFEIVYSRENNISNAIIAGALLLLVVIVFFTVKYLKRKKEFLLDKFSLGKIENRLVLFQLLLWSFIALHIFIVLAFIYGVIDMMTPELMLVTFMLAPLYILPAIVGVIIYFMILRFILKKGFGVISRYKKGGK